MRGAYGRRKLNTPGKKKRSDPPSGQTPQNQGMYGGGSYPPNRQSGDPPPARPLRIKGVGGGGGGRATKGGSCHPIRPRGGSCHRRHFAERRANTPLSLPFCALRAPLPPAHAPSRASRALPRLPASPPPLFSLLFSLAPYPPPLIRSQTPFRQTPKINGG